MAPYDKILPYLFFRDKTFSKEECDGDAFMTANTPRLKTGRRISSHCDQHKQPSDQKSNGLHASRHHSSSRWAWARRNGIEWGL